MANEIISELILDLDKFREKLKEAEGAGKESGQKAGQSIGDGVEEGLNNAGSKVLKTAAKIGAAIAAAFAIHKIMEAAKEGDDAVQRFNSALAANNMYSQAASERFQEFADSMQKVTTASNDAIVKNGALLVSMAGLSGPGLERASKAALDLSAGLQIDLGTAFQMVGRAAEGNTRAFQQLGIRVAETGSTAGNFAATLAVIETRFKGMAEAQTQTFGGAMAQAKNNFEDLLKVIGQMVTRSPLIVGIIQEISKWFSHLGDAIVEFASGRDVIGDLIRSLVTLGLSIAQYVIPPFEAMYNAGKYVFNAIVEFANATLRAVLLVANGIVTAVNAVSGKFGDLKLTLDTMLQANADAAVQMAQNTATSFNEIFDFSFTAGTETMLAKADAFVQQFGEKMAQLPDQFGPPAERLTKQQIALMDATRQNMALAMGNIVSGGMQRVGAALLRGGDAFADFRNFVLTQLGDMCIRQGEMMVKQSAAFEALAALISNPFTAAGASLAFGLALIALGGLMKAAASGSAGGAASAAGGGGGVAAGDGSGFAGGATAQQAQIEKQEPQTKVTVNVHGNILDRRETGLELANIINETFGSQGVTYATAGA